MNVLSAWFYRQLALWSQIFKRPEVAFEYWQRVLTLKPGDARTLAAMALIRARDADKSRALELMAQASRLEPANPGYWFNHGYLLQEQGQHEPALASFDEALRLNPKLDAAWYGRALSLIKLNRLEEAVSALEQNTQLQPMSPYGWYQLAHVYKRLGQADAVKKVIRKVSGFEPKVAEQLQRETGIDIGFKSPI